MIPDLKYLPSIIFFLFMISFACFCQAEEESLCLSADHQYTYAQSLFDEKKYDLALVELSRFIEFFPDDPRFWQARYTLALCRMENGDPVGARDIFDKLMSDDASGVWGIESYFMMARLHMRTGNPILGEICLKNLLTLTRDPELKDRVLSAMAWMRIETAQWAPARSFLNQISEKNRNTYHVTPIMAELEKTHEIRRKNPRLAGTLSIVPGAGYLYCGRYKDALVSFILNGGFILAAYESFDHDHYALGGLITFVGFGFYAGNIYGAASSAHKYNQAANRDFISRLKENVLPSASIGLWTSPDRQAGLALQCHF